MIMKLIAKWCSGLMMVLKSLLVKKFQESKPVESGQQVYKNKIKI